jgi:hypothetical protein
MSGITAEEMRARAEDVARIAHSTAMEGGGVPEPAMAALPSMSPATSTRPS